jgi:hypothetical protein
MTVLIATTSAAQKGAPPAASDGHRQDGASLDLPRRQIRMPHQRSVIR